MTDSQGKVTTVLDVANPVDNNNPNNCIARLSGGSNGSVTFNLNGSNPGGSNPGIPPGHCA